MGLIKAAIGAVGGVLADQWKEFFYCDALSSDVLMTKGIKQTSGRSSNTKGSDNIISDGSGIAVADGQCMIIVEQGKVVELCAEPGEYKFDRSTEPSIFTGSLGDSILETFKTIGKRFTYGADTGKDQRVYYFNTKEIFDNKFGTPNPIPFAITDKKIGFNYEVSLRCSGVYSYVISDPMLFYTNVCANVEREFTRDQIDGQLKTEFISALQPALAKVAALEVMPSTLMAHTTDVENAINETLSSKWGKTRGLKVKSVAFGSVTLPPEDMEAIQKIQRRSILRDPTMAGATLVEAQAEAMTKAAENEGGAMNGFVGMGFAANQGNINAGELFAMGKKDNNGASASEINKDGWQCTCGAAAFGKFCQECGRKKPDKQWKCSCGIENTGKFCTNCGAKKPKGAVSYKCDKCGWEAKSGTNPPKFCAECGDVINDEDII